MKSQLTNLFYGTILTILVMIALAIFIVLSVPVYIFRLLLILLAKYFRPDLGEILSGLNSILSTELFRGKPLRSNIVISNTFEGRFTLEELKALVSKNWLRAVDKQSGQLLFPKFQQYPVRWCGFTFYKKAYDTFNLDNHVHCHDSLGGESSFATEEDVTNFTEKLLNAPYQPLTPLWEVHLVQNYQDPKTGSGELSVILIKLHHSLADGYSMLECGKALMEFDLDEVKMPTPRPPPKIPLSEQIITNLTFPFQGCYEIYQCMCEALRESPWKVEDDHKDWYQYIAHSEPIPVKTVSEIKNEFGVTFTSVLVSSLSAAISKNFALKVKNGKLSEDDEACNSLYFFNTLPLIGNRQRLTNKMTGTIFHIPTSIWLSPVERLRSCFRILEESRTSVWPWLGQLGSLVAGAHFNSIGRELVLNRSISIGLTNFPSLPIKAAMNGRPFVRSDVAVGCNAGVTGVGIMMLSYASTIRVTIVAEKAVMSKDEAKLFLEDIRKEINLLHKKAMTLTKMDSSHLFPLEE